MFYLEKEAVVTGLNGLHQDQEQNLCSCLEQLEEQCDKQIQWTGIN